MHNGFTFSILKSMNHKKMIHYKITQIIVCLQLEMVYLNKVRYFDDYRYYPHFQF